MKICPNCKADIEDNANFCLYCMTSLNEKAFIATPKRKGLWILLAGILILVTVVGAAFWIWPHGTAPQPQAQMQQPALVPQGEETALPTESESTGDQTLPEVTTATEEAPAQTQGSQQPSYTPPVYIPVATQPSVTLPETTDPPVTSQPVTSPPVTEPEETPTEPVQTEPEPTQTTPPASTSVFHYRLAESGDGRYVNYTNPGNHIVITGVNIRSSDGTYRIPAYIDGQKVITIAKNAFTGSGARRVYVPNTVQCIRDFAFYGCPLTDLYYAGEFVELGNYALYDLPEGLTIHCSATCHDGSYRKFKDYAESSWDCQWEEWNG